MAIPDSRLFAQLGGDLRQQVGRATSFLRNEVGRATHPGSFADQGLGYQQLRTRPGVVPSGLPGGLSGMFPGGVAQIFAQRMGGQLMPGSLPSFGRSSPGTLGRTAGLAQPTVTSPASQEAKRRDQAATATAAAAGGAGGTGSTGLFPETDKWRTLIDEAAAANGIDGDAIQAIMMIESQGNPNARSGAGALSLMQVMPFWFGPGEDGMDPRTNVMKGAKILADNYRRYGTWDGAVAAYLGAVDDQGHPTTSTDMYGTSGVKYAALFNDYYQKIKAARAKQQPAAGATGGGSGMASIWGGQGGAITQAYGTVDPSIDQGIYGYGAAYGLPQGHTGDDIGLKRGTQLYMPAGLTGVVETAGGTPYFRDEDYGDRGTPGKGELRIRLSNGDILILGHTSQIGVQAGQQVSAGQALALSGSASGDHLHLEVRVRQPDGSYRLVDPTTYFH